VELRSTAQQYTFELLFRSQELTAGQNPSVPFTNLSSSEAAIRKFLTANFAESTEFVALDIEQAKEARLLFFYWWYFSQPCLSFQHNADSYKSEIPDTLSSIKSLADASTASHTLNELGLSVE